MKKSFLILLVLCVMGMFVSSHAENTYKNPYYEKGYLGNVALVGYSYYNLSYSSVYVSPSVGIDVGKLTFFISYIFHDCLVIVYDNYTDIPQIDLGSDAIQAFKNHWLSFTVALNF